MSLLCVGSVAYDVIELPGRAPVEVLGGSGTYFTTAASLLTKPSLVAVVGDDFLEADRSFLEGRGVDTTGLLSQVGKTFRWHARYHADMKGRDTLKTDLGVFADFDPCIGKAHNRPDILFLGNIKPSLQRCVTEQARAARFVGLDTIECWIKGDRDELVSLLKSADIAFLNDDEVVELGGHSGIITAAHRVMDMGVRYLVVKRGEHGSMLFFKDRIWLFPAFPIESVVDPTGAGDTFAGGTLAFLDVVQDFSPPMIRLGMAVGTVMASFCVEGFGPRHFENVSLSRFQERLKSYFEMLLLDGDRAIEAVAFTGRGIG